MGLIKERVLDIERKTKYAKIVMRVLKECKLVDKFTEYARSKEYATYVKIYLNSNKSCTSTWYDREFCASILGCCNFQLYVYRFEPPKYNPYNLVLAYLELFETKEFKRYMASRGYLLTRSYVDDTLNECACSQGRYDKEIVLSWILKKEGKFVK